MMKKTATLFAVTLMAAASVTAPAHAGKFKDAVGKAAFAAIWKGSCVISKITKKGGALC